MPVAFFKGERRPACPYNSPLLIPNLKTAKALKPPVPRPLPRRVIYMIEFCSCASEYRRAFLPSKVTLPAPPQLHQRRHLHSPRAQSE